MILTYIYTSIIPRPAPVAPQGSSLRAGMILAKPAAHLLNVVNIRNTGHAIQTPPEYWREAFIESRQDLLEPISERNVRDACHCPVAIKTDWKYIEWWMLWQKFCHFLKSEKIFCFKSRRSVWYHGFQHHLCRAISFKYHPIIGPIPIIVRFNRPANNAA